ncbi:MAG: ATP-grasp domain-containing protein [Sandaracinaceae bacterium]|nr:ATP-grasp domain-containing protein [Sandaracinaceae bacterium]
MRHIVFVAPHFLPNTNRYLQAFASLEGVLLSVVSEDPLEAMPPPLRSKLGGHYRVRSTLDGKELTEALRRIARAIRPIDRLTGALEELQIPMAEARSALGIEGMGIEIARRFRNKDEMKAVLRAHGVPVAPSTLARSLEELEAFIRRFGYPIVIKPRAGLGTRSTHRVDKREELEDLIEAGFAPSPERPLQVERFIRAREHTCETVSIFGRTIWRSGTRYFPSPLEVLETPWIQYTILLPREADDPTWTRFHPINEAALQALFGEGLGTPASTALTHMEWFLTEEGEMLVSEVGARPPGVQIMPLMSIAHESDLIRDWAELIAFDRFTPKERKWAAGAAFFRGQGRGKKIVSVSGVEEAIKACGDALVEAQFPKLGQARSSSYEGEGWALVRSPTTQGAKAALLTLIQKVQIRYGD